MNMDDITQSSFRNADNILIGAGACGGFGLGLGTTGSAVVGVTIAFALAAVTYALATLTAVDVPLGPHQ